MSPYVIPGLQQKDIHHSADMVLDFVSVFYNMPRYRILSKSSNQVVVNIRRKVFWILHAKLKMSLVRIAKIFNKDHSTVIHNIKKHNGYMDVYPEYRREMYKLIFFVFLEREIVEPEVMEKPSVPIAPLIRPAAEYTNLKRKY